MSYKQDGYHGHRGPPAEQWVQDPCWAPQPRWHATVKWGPITSNFEDQWNLCLGNLRGCGKPRLCFERAWPTHKLNHSKSQNRGSSFKSAWVICETHTPTNFETFAREVRICWNFLWGWRHWQEPFFLDWFCFTILTSSLSPPLVGIISDTSLTC